MKRIDYDRMAFIGKSYKLGPALGLDCWINVLWLCRIMDNGEIWPICEIGETLGM